MLETSRSLLGETADRNPPRDPEGPQPDSDEVLHARRERLMDEILAQTFPASDPPAWNSIRESEEGH